MVLNQELIAAPKLKLPSLLKAAEALKIFVRRHRKRSHTWCRQTLGLSHSRYWRLLSIAQWPKKVKSLVAEDRGALSQTRLFSYATKRWRSARELFTALRRDIAYLAQRKRRALTKGTGLVPRAGEACQATPSKTFLVRYLTSWRSLALSIVTSSPKALSATLEARGYILVELVERTQAGERLVWRHQGYRGPEPGMLEQQVAAEQQVSPSRC